MQERQQDYHPLDQVILPGEVLRRLGMIMSLIDTIRDVPITSERKKFLLACFEKIRVELDYLTIALGD